MNLTQGHLDMVKAGTEVAIRATRNSLGGGYVAAIGYMLHTYSPECVVCGQTTVFGAAATDPARFEVGHLIPSSYFGVARSGYVVGNLATMCRACNDAAGDYVFNACDVDAERVPIVWPRKRDILAAYAEYKGSETSGHADRAASARAARGLPF